MHFLFETQIDLGSKANNSPVFRNQPLQGLIVNDPKILELRAIRDELRLTTQEIVQELKIQGLTVTHSALQAYLQGNVLGSDIRNMPAFGRATKQNHIEVLLEQFRIMHARLHPRYEKMLSKPMKEIVLSWYRDCNINGASKEMKLSEIIGKHFTTIFKWVQENRYPRSTRQLCAYQDMVDAYAKQLKSTPKIKEVIPARRAEQREVFVPNHDLLDVLKRVNPTLVEKMADKLKKNHSQNAL